MNTVVCLVLYLTAQVYNDQSNLVGNWGPANPYPVAPTIVPPPSIQVIQMTNMKMCDAVLDWLKAENPGLKGTCIEEAA